MEKLWESVSTLNNRFFDLYKELHKLQEEVKILKQCLQEIKIVCDEGVVETSSSDCQNNLTAFI